MEIDEEELQVGTGTIKRIVSNRMEREHQSGSKVRQEIEPEVKEERNNSRGMEIYMKMMETSKSDRFGLPREH